jgi:hypothetical protein
MGYRDYCACCDPTVTPPITMKYPCRMTSLYGRVKVPCWFEVSMATSFCDETIVRLIPVWSIDVGDPGVVGYTSAYSYYNEDLGEFENVGAKVWAFQDPTPDECSRLYGNKMPQVDYLTLNLSPQFVAGEAQVWSLGLSNYPSLSIAPTGFGYGGVPWVPYQSIGSPKEFNYAESTAEQDPKVYCHNCETGKGSQLAPPATITLTPQCDDVGAPWAVQPPAYCSGHTNYTLASQNSPSTKVYEVPLSIGRTWLPDGCDSNGLNCTGWVLDSVGECSEGVYLEPACVPFSNNDTQFSECFYCPGSTSLSASARTRQYFVTASTNKVKYVRKVKAGKQRQAYRTTQRDPASVSAEDESMFRILQCPHRGGKIGQVACNVCGQQGKKADLYECAQFGSCTIKKRNHKVKNCAACDYAQVD